jgi:galactokinase
MPAAIDRETIFAIAESTSTQSSLYSITYNEFFSVDLKNPQPTTNPTWANYLLGVIRKLTDMGFSLKPFHCVFDGNIPLGAGLSSSASLECGFGFALAELNNLDIDKQRLIEIAQWAEHNYAGVKCGIMDQFASMMGEENQALLLDCRSMEYRYLPIKLNDVAIVLCDTKVKHALVNSDYNTRRSECEQGVSILKKHYPSINSLRDVSESIVLKHKEEFPGKVFNRCLYVVQEIDRVQQAAKDLENHDLKAFGKKMFETHDGLSKLYEVSCPELDFLADQARTFAGVLGARMMGGGFGGCTINLVQKDVIQDFIGQMKTAYKKQFGIEMEDYRVNVMPGTSLLEGTQMEIR